MREIRFRQMQLFFIAFLPVTKIFFLPSAYARVANSDMWLGALINILLDVLTLVAVLFFWRRFQGKSLYKALEEGAGIAAAKTVYALYFIYFIIKAYIPFLEQKNFVELTLYENTANILMFMPIFIFSIYLSVKKASTLGRLADMLALITLIGLALIFALAVSNTDFGAILPIGVNGPGKILQSSYYAMPWYGDAVYMLFLAGDLVPQKKCFARTLAAYIFSGMTVVLFMVLFYGTFSSIAVRQNFALTEISKYSTVINNIGRFDYLAIFCILFSSIFALCLPVYFAAHCLRRLFNLHGGLASAVVVGTLIFIMIISTVQIFAAVQGFIQKYLSGFLFLMSNVVPALVLLVRRKDRAQKTAES